MDALCMTGEASLSGPCPFHRLDLVHPGYLAMLWILTTWRCDYSNFVFPLGDLCLMCCGSPWRG